MQDDFNWGYVGQTKDDAIEKIKKDFKAVAGYDPDILAEWYEHIVLDCGKSPVYLDEYKHVILSNCDSALHWNDNSPYNKEKLS